MSNNQVIGTEPCPKCQEQGLDNSGDNRVYYDNGGYWCFACGEGDIEPKKGLNVAAEKFKNQVKAESHHDLISGKVQALPSRGLSKDICEFFRIEVGSYSGSFNNSSSGPVPVKIFNYLKDDKVYCQKIKTQNKDMKILGDTRDIPLYGKWLWPEPNPNIFITIVEGEEDAAAAVQVCGKTFPVVSIPTGAGGAFKAIKNNLQYLMGWKHVVLCFDSDTPGLDAMKKCLTLFEPGKVKIARMSEKDINELLLKGKESEIRSCIFNAEVPRPKSVVTMSDITEEILKRPESGMSYPFPSLTKFTYGLKFPEINIIAGGTGLGKTEFIKDITFHLLSQGLNVGYFSFEQRAADSARRMIGAKFGVKLHLPVSDQDWNEEKIKEEIKSFDKRLFLYNEGAGVPTPESLFKSLRFCNKVDNVQVFFIDNLKPFRINTQEDASNFMNQLKALTMELKITVFLVSHLNKDTYNKSVSMSTSKKNNDEQPKTAEEMNTQLKKPGLDWESGRMPTLGNIEGFSIVTQLADNVLGLARNSQSEDDIESRILVVRMLKARHDSRFCGQQFKLIYTDEGKLEEV